jgi:glycosyltransferase involved in cell wall biosynthesis
VSIGLLDPMKGHDVAIAALQRLRASGDDVRLEIIGDGPLRDELLAAATSARVRDHVDLAGPLPQPEVLRRMASAAAVVVPSRRLAGKAEGTPTVMLEALAVGAPLVVSQSSGWETPVDRGAEVVIVPDEDPPALAAAVERVLADPEAAAALAERSRAVSRQFAWPVAVASVDAVYERAASGPAVEV